MIDLIFAAKFVHMLAIAVMFGGWLAIALFMLFAHRSRTASVIALTARFVVSAERLLMAPAVALVPLSGFALSSAIDLSTSDEPWLLLSIVIYAVTVAAWVGCVVFELRIRKLTRRAVLDHVPLPAESYRPLFRLWSLCAAPFVLGTIAIFVLMVWQPH